MHYWYCNHFGNLDTQDRCGLKKQHTEVQLGLLLQTSQQRKKLIPKTALKNHQMSLNSAVHGWSRGFKNAGGRRTTSVPYKQSIHLKSSLTPEMRRGPFLIKGNFKDFCKKWNAQITAFSKARGCFASMALHPQKSAVGSFGFTHATEQHQTPNTTRK